MKSIILSYTNLKDNFESHIYDRGVDYYYYNQVESLSASRLFEPTEIEITGQVKGTKNYRVSFVFDIETYDFSGLQCSCPYDDHCKHLVALGLEFLDYFEEFAKTQNEESERNRDFRNSLTEWINSNKTRKFNKTKEGLEYIEEENADIEDMPEAAESIKAELESRGALNFERQENNLSPSKSRLKNKEKFDLERYSIVMSNFHIFGIKVLKDFKTAMFPGEILEEYTGFNQWQRKLFDYLNKKINSYGLSGKIDLGEFLRLVKNSGLKIYWQESFFDDRRKLNFVEKNESIKAKLSYNPVYNEFIDHTYHNFVFELDEKYETDKYGRSQRPLYLARGHIIVFAGSEIHLLKIPKTLINIISRIELMRVPGLYSNTNLLSTYLTEEEIINLEKIIKQAKTYLDFKMETDVPSKVKRVDKKEPCLCVDFNAKLEKLEIQPVLDYGHRKVNVSNTIYYCNKKFYQGLKRRDQFFEQKYLFDVKNDIVYYSKIDKKSELDLFKIFYNREETGFTKFLKCKREGMRKIYEFYQNNWPVMKDLAEQKGCSIRFIKDEFNFTEENFSADFQVDLNAENDWLWFDVNCYCGKNKITPADLKTYIQNKKDFIKMKDGKLLKVANREELEKFVMMLESFYTREEGGFEGGVFHAPELEHIFTSSEYYNAKVKNSFNKFIKEVKSGKPVRKVKLNSKYDKLLRDYQKEGIDWFYFLRKYRFAGILADDMGLGKTLQTLILLEKEKIKGKPSIVICPKSIVHNWKAEAEKFVPGLNVSVVDGTPAERKEIIKNSQRKDLLITGYATVKNDVEYYDKRKIKFNYCVLDEAQFIKNHATKNSKVVKGLDAEYRLALTGTPIENSVSEIWSIFDFLMPGFLGSYQVFKKKFLNPIMKENDHEALKLLRKKTECFMLRRVKSEVVQELPPKVEQVSYCRLGKSQNILYQEVLANVKAEIFENVKLKGFNKSKIQILAGLTKLRQICNHPVLLLKEKDYTKYESAKLNLFNELIDEMIGNNKKTLVFSQFTTMLKILAEELKNKGIDFNYLAGDTKNRQKLVDEFNNQDDKKVFLISLKAGGTGLNLTSADNVVIFDPWWNPSVENQAVDRAHRIGQKSSVNVYRLISRGTIEEKIVKLQERKKYLFDNLVDESQDLFQKITWDDVKDLFAE